MTQVDTMVAQSLDLPPSAARWRQHQRKQNDKQAARRASGHFPVAAIPWATPSKPAGPSAADMAAVEDIVGEAQVGTAVASGLAVVLRELGVCWTALCTRMLGCRPGEG